MTIISKLELAYCLNRLTQLIGSPKGSDILKNKNFNIKSIFQIYNELHERIKNVFGRKGLDAHGRTLATIIGGTLLAVGAIGIATPLV